MRKLLADSQLMTDSDEELLVLIQSSKDPGPAGELYKRYAHLVYGICMKYLKNSEISKDVMMDIFEKFLKKPPVEDILSFKKWLYTVSKHHCLTYLRNTKRAENHEEEWKSFENNEDDFMEYGEERSHDSRENDIAQVREALKKLKEPQRICLQLFYMEGKSYKEIEDKTEYDLNQIKSYLQNGKRKLKILVESS